MITANTTDTHIDDDRTLVEVVHIHKDTVVYTQYQGEFEPQPVSIEVSLDTGLIIVDIDSEVGCVFTPRQFGGVDRNYSIPATASATDINKLLDVIAPLAQQMIDNAETGLDRDGNPVGRVDDDDDQELTDTDIELGLDAHDPISLAIARFPFEGQHSQAAIDGLIREVACKWVPVLKKEWAELVADPDYDFEPFALIEAAGYVENALSFDQGVGGIYPIPYALDYVMGGTEFSMFELALREGTVPAVELID
ncbi:hypothetical protein Gbro_0531 [Gordonia bronchialis DSM 43247]|uniref:Uncharacterized protein n=1 Tax=Gordonia bronchialis (strain ATCC 25592 / DSM 43247 / BCRC 13721 / JCM 3198 / KCTC 3076 / NBRC 16047 / NCTC 10667) TaxID=526226 RepID=D0LEE3_GORB4|nr:hypothetical protein [Gordonia bronchialis]ACY19861.1 hypothetical protein Gbro_0531 [Gordonia bronchialis DSM 43247]MCC3322634.1 hypothetical protein [Gordonia bronchialis]QGS26270.1 hypothetical protein FOB84_21175 [Gordonia bronchialis]STQ62638.1 Uncharacterised protein [Gordonia bronchialis]